MISFSENLIFSGLLPLGLPSLSNDILRGASIIKPISFLSLA
jgi:hypothetical protein